MMELYQYLCVVAPFGSLLDNSVSNTKLLMVNGYPQGPMPRQKVPAWRPVVHKGVSRLILHIREEVNTMQYDNPNIPDDGEVFGSVICKAELDGCPDVQLTLAVPPGCPPLDNFVIHSCVTSADTNPIMMQGPGIATATPMLSRKLRFSTLPEQFTLCSYTISDLTFLPIRGFYQMKGDSSLKLLLQLKLDQNVKNSFEKCEVQLPFYHRGPIERVDNISPASVQLSLSQDKYKIIWNIGQKFPTKSLELFLQATVHFPEVIPPVPEGVVVDPFCVGLNSYAEVHFKLSDYMFSGCSIDQKSISLFPQAKYKLQMSRECQSQVYKIWNSHGDVECTFPPPKKA
ncbi:AP-5 complex subunit mu-1-like [Dysidea avara]|uniref:AP-5 complex subunit mu-1-like n=1 Tax=Dysidea avara TaxID=196820 RepID=UPI003328CF30